MLYGGKRTTFRRWFSPFTMWVLGIELRFGIKYLYLVMPTSQPMIPFTERNNKNRHTVAILGGQSKKSSLHLNSELPIIQSSQRYVLCPIGSVVWIKTFGPVV